MNNFIAGVVSVVIGFHVLFGVLGLIDPEYTVIGMLAQMYVSLGIIALFFAVILGVYVALSGDWS